MLAAVSRDIREVIGTLWGFSSLDARRRSEQVAEQHRRIADAIARARPARPPQPRCATTCVWAAQADLHGVGEQAELRLPTATVAE